MSATTEKNYYAELARIDCSEHIDKKGKFSYLSWAWAVDCLRKAHPEATWEIKRFDGMPFLKTELGYFVEVSVIVAGVTLSQVHPVLNGANKTIEKPTAFDINTSIQRCLVKAIALHGLGLYVYAGEDLPEGVEKEAPPQTPIKLADSKTLTQLATLVRDTGSDIDRLKHKYGVARLEELSQEAANHAIGLLRKKLDQQQSDGLEESHNKIPEDVARSYV